jgi:dolichyl-phosphate-mannose-protein mannosyltransferase
MYHSSFQSPHPLTTQEQSSTHFPTSLHPPSMQRSNHSSASSRSTNQTATSSLRRTLRSNPSYTHDHESDDDVSDPRPWETRGPLNLYGSSKDNLSQSTYNERPSSPIGDLPLYEMETRRRVITPTPGPGYGEKENVMGLGLEGKELISQTQDDGDSGKWGKGFGVGPGYGGKRGLPPRQKRIPGWVSLCDE